MKIKGKLILLVVVCCGRLGSDKHVSIVLLYWFQRELDKWVSRLTLKLAFGKRFLKA